MSGCDKDFLIAYLADTLSKLAIPRTLLKDTQGLDYLGVHFRRIFYDVMTGDIWFMTTRIIKPVLHPFGASLVLSSGRYWNVVR
jgi:hypothetical protein